MPEEAFFTAGEFTFQCGSTEGRLLSYTDIINYKFTFQCGSTEGSAHLAEASAQLNLHSSVVLLKVIRPRSIKDSYSYLHSSVVLLKETFPAISKVIGLSFTFQCGSTEGGRVVDCDLGKT